MLLLYAGNAAESCLRGVATDSWAYRCPACNTLASAKSSYVRLVPSNTVTDEHLVQKDAVCGWCIHLDTTDVRCKQHKHRVSDVTQCSCKDYTYYRDT